MAAISSGRKLRPATSDDAKRVDGVLVRSEVGDQLRVGLLLRVELEMRDDIGAVAAQRNGLAGKRVAHARDLPQGLQVGADVGIDLGRVLAHRPAIADDEQVGFVGAGGTREMHHPRATISSALEATASVSATCSTISAVATLCRPSAARIGRSWMKCSAQGHDENLNGS